jgi:hypothetical protein
MSSQPSEKHFARFDDIDVTITVPWQGKKVKTVRKSKPAEGSLKSGRDEFTPGRIVFDFDVVEDVDATKHIPKFNPPMTVKIAYTAADYQRAQAKHQDLVLGFWDGSHWVKFTAAKHKFQLVPNNPPSSGGYGLIELTQFIDPPTGWGP